MMRHYRMAALATLAVPLLVLGSALQTRAAVPTSRERTNAHKTVQVTIQNFAFSPGALTVAPGATITWTNRDSAPHTVTSDTGAWTDSGTLATGKSFSLTLTKPGTYAYHCAVHPRMTATIVVSSHGSSGVPGMGSGGPGMGMMGPMSMTSMTAFTGYYDDHKLLYVSTDTSSKDEAARDHINYAPSLAKSLSSANEIYLVTNGRYASRGAVFGSQPGKDDYTPLWQEVRVTWQNPSQAVPLGKDDQIKSLAKSGKLTLTMTGTVLNCPIIKVMSGGAA